MKESFFFSSYLELISFFLFKGVCFFLFPFHGWFSFLFLFSYSLQNPLILIFHHKPFFPLTYNMYSKPVFFLLPKFKREKKFGLIKTKYLSYFDLSLSLDTKTKAFYDETSDTAKKCIRIEKLFVNIYMKLVRSPNDGTQRKFASDKTLDYHN